MQDNYCSVKCSPTKCCVLGGIKTCLFPAEIWDFPERRKSDWGHQQLLVLGNLGLLGQDLDLPCRCSEQAAEAPHQVVFGNCGFVEVSAFLSASI